jgi:hypothetical protein
VSLANSAARWASCSPAVILARKGAVIYLTPGEAVIAKFLRAHRGAYMSAERIRDHYNARSRSESRSNSYTRLANCF